MFNNFFTTRSDRKRPPDTGPSSAKSAVQTGRRNLSALYTYTGASRLWFDGGVWVIYWQHQGISIFQVGLLEALLHVVAVLSDVLLGVFADRFGWKVALSASALCGVMYCAISLVAHGFLLAALAFAFRGLQVTLANGSDSALMYESAVVAGLSDRYLTISGRMVAIGLVSMGVAEMVGATVATWSWSALYLAFLGANLASLVAVLWIREPRDWAVVAKCHVSDEPEAGVRADNVYLSMPVVDPVLHRFALAIAVDAIRFARHNAAFARWIVLSGTLSGFLATFAFYGQSLLRETGWTLIAIGVLSAFENGLGAVASVRTARLVERIGERRTIGTAGGLAVIGLLLFAWVPGLGAGLGFLVNSVAGNVADPVIDLGLNRIVPTQQRATLLSFNSTAFSLFMVVVFPLFGLLAAHIGIVRTAEIASVVGAVAILLVTWWWAGGRAGEVVPESL